MYKHLFGPVPSRRLGMSLGVDLVPLKTCTLNCIYCECGGTTNLTLNRKEYISFEEVTKELKDYFIHNPEPDYITFSGSGEPTLNSRIGDVINFIKQEKPSIPIAVLTNGTLFNEKQVRTDLLPVDLVLPSLDAGTIESFYKINEPCDDLNLFAYVQGLKDFRKEFTGKIWLEVFILPGYNDDRENLSAMRKIIEEMNPDRLQLNTLDRPGVVSDIRAATSAELKDVVNFLGFANTEIIAASPNRKNIKSYREDIESAILETISRRPCTSEDLGKILGTHVNEINKYLDVLENDKKIKHTRQGRGIFYHISD